MHMRYLGIAVVLTLGIAVAGCSDNSNQVPVAAGCAKKNVVIVQNSQNVPSLSRIDIYIAETLGYFAEECIAIQHQYANGGVLAAQLIASGQADLGPLLMEPVIEGYNKGVKGKFFYQKSKHVTMSVAVLADGPVTSFADLAGATIGVQSLASTHISISKVSLKSAGVDVNQVKYLPVGIDQGALLALEQHKVDALALADSAFFTLEAAGLTKNLRFLVDPNLQDVGHYGYFVNDDYMKANPEVMKGFARAISKGFVFETTNVEAAARIFYKYSPSAESQGLENTVHAIEKNLENLSPEPPFGQISTGPLATYITNFAEADGVANPPTIDELTTNEFISFANDFDADKIREEARNYKTTTG